MYSQVLVVSENVEMPDTPAACSSEYHIPMRPCLGPALYELCMHACMVVDS